MKTSFGLLCFFIFFAILFVSAFGQQTRTDSIFNLFDSELEDLMEMEILHSAASNIEKLADRQHVSVTTLSEKELMLSGGRTLLDAIMLLVPGFFIVEDQDDVIAGFRGLAPDNNAKVMLLINGQNLNTEWFWGPPAAILNSSNFGYIEKIEIIRGPGSITLGQGALLGVINIITKTSSKLYFHRNVQKGNINFIAGKDNCLGIEAESFAADEKSHLYFYGSRYQYHGQSLQNVGWIKDKPFEGYKGGSIYNSGVRLKRAENNLFFTQFGFKNFASSIMYSDYQSDLYNFYRDRNQYGQTLFSFFNEYNAKLNEKFMIRLNTDATMDNHFLYSVDGYDMGGCREDRYGGKVIVTSQNLVKGMKLAFGAEWRRFEFGKQNINGYNFINNTLDSLIFNDYHSFISLANQHKTWGYVSNISIGSLVAEAIYKVHENAEIFGAARFDRHTSWGQHVSPRLGIIFYPTSKLIFRCSYQSGFRGAVGLHYGGGYRQDGLLKADNLNQIETAQIPLLNDSGQIIGEYEKNIQAVKPELMHSIELAGIYRVDKNNKISVVGFFNQINNIIDVGVIYRNKQYYTMPQIGTDVPGDWNGYWFFKNSSGIIRQAGAEAIVDVAVENLKIIVSHSYVMLLEASAQQAGSMYVTAKNHFKAYPENVSRMQLRFGISNKTHVAATGLYYYNWYSPTDQLVQGNFMLNFSVLAELSKAFNVQASILNVLGQTHLYPMNSNAGDARLSDGTPAYEKTTFVVKAKYLF